MEGMEGNKDLGQKIREELTKEEVKAIEKSPVFQDLVLDIIQDQAKAHLGEKANKEIDQVITDFKKGA